MTESSATTSPARARYFNQHWTWWFMVAVLVLMAMVRLRLLNFSLERDEGEYAYAGQLMLHGHSALQTRFQHEVSRHLRDVCAHHGAVRRDSGGNSLRCDDHHHADGADALLARQADAGSDGGHGGGDQLCCSRGQHRLVWIGGTRRPLRGVFCDRRFVFDVESPADGAMANGRGRGNHVRHGDADETTRGHHRGVGIRSFCLGHFSQKSDRGNSRGCGFRRRLRSGPRCRWVCAF